MDTYFEFLKKHKDTMLCFVNDASTDNTKLLLQNVESAAHHNMRILEHSKNRGKVAAVLSGRLYSNSNIGDKKIAYLDADLSTSLNECYVLSLDINKRTKFAFGSRIRKLDSFIKRQPTSMQQKTITLQEF